MPRIPFVVSSARARATIVDAQANKPATVSRYAYPDTLGDPDLQGIYTNRYELNTPFERPKAFEGRRMEDVTTAELSEMVRQRQAEVVTGRTARRRSRRFEMSSSRPGGAGPGSSSSSGRADSAAQARCCRSCDARRRQHLCGQRTLAGDGKHCRRAFRRP